jgi:hypothetical protein
MSRQVKFRGCRRKAGFHALVGLLTVGVRPAPQTTSRTRTRASLGNPSAPLIHWRRERILTLGGGNGFRGCPSDRALF